MSDSLFPKRPRSDAELARKSFEASREILREANHLSKHTFPSKETLAEAEKIRVEADKLISLLESGINKANLNKIDEAARNLGRICLNIQQMTIKYRVEK